MENVIQIGEYTSPEGQTLIKVLENLKENKQINIFFLGSSSDFLEKSTKIELWKVKGLCRKILKDVKNKKIEALIGGIQNKCISLLNKQKNV